MIRSILLLGDPRLYETSQPVAQSELDSIRTVAEDLHDTLLEFRRIHGIGRAIAAPQIGVHKRLICMNIGEKKTFLNPRLEFVGEERFLVRDDCMSFPGLFVDVMRYKKLILHYRDWDWKEQSWELEGDLAELLQHEYDHLDGILATMRAVDPKAFYFKQK